MRSYIFTKKERKAIEDFLAGRVGSGEHFIRQIRWRLRLFENLRNDIELYRRLAESEPTVPT